MAKLKADKKKNSEQEIKNSVNTSFWFTNKGQSVIVFIFSFLLFFNSTFNDYNLDDELVVQNNKLTQQGISAIPEIFQSPYYSDANGFKYEYRPLVLVTFAIEHSIFGNYPFISHLINLLLYSLSCVLLLLVLKTVFKTYNIFLPLVATLIFASHPVHTEVVDSIKNRDELLVLIFGLLSLYFSILYVQSQKIGSLFALAIFMLLGMLSKPSASVFVFLIPITLVFFFSVRYASLILVTVLLFIPTIILSRLYYFKEQLILGIALFVVISFFYYLRNSKLVLQASKHVFATIKQSLFVPPNDKEQFSTTQLFTQFIIVFFIAAIGVAGLLLPNLWLIGISLAGLVACFIFLSENTRLFVLPSITGLVTYFVLQFGFDATVLDAALLLLIQIYFVSTNKKLQLVSWICYAVYAIISLFLLKSVFAISILLFAGFWIKKPFWIRSALVSVAIVWTLVQLYFYLTGARLTYAWLSYSILLIGAGMLWFNKQKLYAITAPLLVLFAFIFLSLTNRQIIPQTPMAKVYREVKKMSYARSIDITPVDFKRPLKFMETPVDENSPTSIRLGTAADILGKYLVKQIFAYPLSYYYGFSYIQPTSIFTLKALIPLFMYLGLGLFILVGVNRFAVLSFCTLWYLSAISIYSSLVVPIPGMLGDRFLLIPSIGFSILIAFLVFKFFKQENENSLTNKVDLKPSLKYLITAILVIYSAITFSRNSNWKDRLTLFRHDITVVENSAQAQNLLALHLYLVSLQTQDVTLQNQLRQEAIPHFKKALEIYPEFLNAAYDLGRCYEAMGNADEAYKAYATAVLIDTTFYAPYFNLALIDHTRGNIDNAIVYYEKFLTKYKLEKEVFANLSFAYYKQSKYEKSIDVNRRAMLSFPTAFEPVVNIAKTFYTIGKLDSALLYFEKAQVLNPTDVNVKVMIDQLSKK